MEHPFLPTQLITDSAILHRDGQSCDVKAYQRVDQVPDPKMHRAHKWRNNQRVGLELERGRPSLFRTETQVMLGVGDLGLTFEKVPQRGLNLITHECRLCCSVINKTLCTTAIWMLGDVSLSAVCRGGLPSLARLPQWRRLRTQSRLKDPRSSSLTDVCVKQKIHQYWSTGINTRSNVLCHYMNNHIHFSASWWLLSWMCLEYI